VRRLLHAAPGIGFLLLAVLAWELVARNLGDRAGIFPPPSVIFPSLAEMAVDGRLLPALGHTLYRLAAGYLLGLVPAVALGLLMGSSASVYRLFEPLVELLRPIPKPALVPPLMFFLGLGDAMKVTIVALAVFFPILINLVQAVRRMEPELLDAARTFGLGRGATLRKVVLPASLPPLMAGMQISLGLALVVVILAEMIGAGVGIGFGVIDAERSFRVKEMYAWVVATAVTGYLLNFLFEKWRERLLHWHRDIENLQRSALQN
jgi:ABC-type nitrate/sulfonate/bicarbonate transport system permease component